MDRRLKEDPRSNQITCKNMMSPTYLLVHFRQGKRSSSRNLSKIVSIKIFFIVLIGGKSPTDI